MKRLLIFIFLLISSFAWAGTTVVVVGQPTTSATVVNFTSTTADGEVKNSSAVSWADVRGAATGADGAVSNGASDNNAACANVLSGVVWFCYRSFLYFDTSAIPDTATITGVKLYLYSAADYPSTACAMKGTQADTLADTDFDSFSGSSYGYATVAAAGNWFYITFDSTGCSDINKTGTTKICVREYDHDYSNVTPGASGSHYYNCGFYYADDTNTPSRKPYIVVTYTP